MNRKFNIPVKENPLNSKNSKILTSQTPHLKSRNAPLVNTFTPNEKQEEKKLIENIHDIRRALRHNTVSKDSTLIPTSRYGPSGIGETDLRMSLEREQLNSSSQRNNIRTTLNNDTPTISNRIMMMGSSASRRDNRVYKNLNSKEFIKGIRPTSSTLRKAWDDDDVEEIKESNEFSKAQKFSKDFVFGSTLKTPPSTTKKMTLPKIEETTSRNILIKDGEEDIRLEENKEEQKAQPGNEKEKEPQSEEEKREEIIENLQLSELPLEESKDQIITEENPEGTKSPPNRKENSQKNLVSKPDPILRKSRTRDLLSLSRRKMLRKRIIFREDHENERMNSEQNLLSERKVTNENLKLATKENSDEDSDFMNSDIDHLLK